MIVPAVQSETSKSALACESLENVPQTPALAVKSPVLQSTVPITDQLAVVGSSPATPVLVIVIGVDKSASHTKSSPISIG